LSFAREKATAKIFHLGSARCLSQRPPRCLHGQGQRGPRHPARSRAAAQRLLHAGEGPRNPEGNARRCPHAQLYPATTSSPPSLSTCLKPGRDYLPFRKPSPAHVPRWGRTLRTAPSVPGKRRVPSEPQRYRNLSAG